MEEIIYYRDHIMVPVDANVYLLEAWEIILIIGVMFAIGFMLGMYITTQIEKWITKRIKK
jgi:hypothetical protein